MNPFPTTFSTHTEPLPVNTLSPMSTQAVAALTEKGYEVHTGLTPEYAERIKEMSLQPSILEYCPKDSAERFLNHAATEKWLAQNRATFLLFKKDDNSLRLAGYGWSGLKESSYVPGGETTFTVRIGEDDQGLGLAAPFSQLIIAGSKSLYGASHMWLEATQSNAGAVHIYKKLGFAVTAERPFERARPNGDTVDDVRLYMLYPDELLN